MQAACTASMNIGSVAHPTDIVRFPGIFRMAQQAGLVYGFKTVRLMKDYPLGRGSYGRVCMAALDDLPCAAKLLHPILVDPNNPRNRTRFEQECRFLSEIRHPNIVQYLGLAHDVESGQSVLLMELMGDSLTLFLEQSEKPLAYHVQVDISHDVALALAFLHSNNIVHRDLSSNNVLLIGPGCRAKVADFGTSKLNPHAASQTNCPGTPVYMAPEALLIPPVYTEKLDCFQAGVLMIQIITRKFPDPGDAMRTVPNVTSPTGWGVIPVCEVDRRQNHICLVPREHPMLPTALSCLKDKDSERPSAQQICRNLSTLKRDPRYSQSLQGDLQRLQGRSGGGGGGGGGGGEWNGQVQEKEWLIQQLKQENKRLVTEKEGEMRKVQHMQREAHMKDEEVQRLQHALQSRPREMPAQMQQSLQAEMQQQHHQIQQLNEEVQALNFHLQQKDHALQQKDYALQQKDHTMRKAQQEWQTEIHHLQNQVQSQAQQLQQKNQTILELERLVPTYTISQSSGPGKQSATVNHPTQVVIELSDSAGRLCSIKQNVTALLRAPGNSPPINAAVAVISPSKYEISYTAVNRGQNHLHIRINGKEVSTLVISVYPDPTQLGRPMRVIRGPKVPHAIAFNNHHQIFVSEFNGNQILVFDIRGQRIGQFGLDTEMIRPRGVAIDDADNIYVTSEHKLQKFDSAYALVKCVGQKGPENGAFEVPSGITIHGEEVYVCDRQNHRIQVFDLNLTFIRTVGSPGKKPGEFVWPCDVKFDGAGRMYVAEHGNERVQVMDKNGQHIRMITRNVGKPMSLHIINDHLYVSDLAQHHVVVFKTSGNYVVSFGWQGQDEGEFTEPNGITSYEGSIYVCDGDNHRIQVF